MDLQRVYLVGSQRSGTTLLRLILESHPRVFCYDELLGYEALMANNVQPRDGATHVVFKIPRWTEQLLDSEVWDYGEPATGPQFYRTGERIIFLVREPKAVVGSMIKLPAVDKSWLETYPAPIIAARLKRDARFAERYGAQFENAQQMSNPAAAVGALYWKYKSASFFDYVEAGMPLALVSYESLVSDPEPVLRDLCDFLEIAWDRNMLHHERLEHTELFPDGSTLGNTDPRTAIHPRSVDAWRNLVSVDDAAMIDGLTEELCTRFAGLFAGRGVVRTHG